MVQPIVYSLSAEAVAAGAASLPAGFLLQLAMLRPTAAVAAATPIVFSHRFISIPFSNRRFQPASLLLTGEFVIIQALQAAVARLPHRRRICGRPAPVAVHRRSFGW